MIGNRPLGVLLALLPAVILAAGAVICASVATVRPRTRPSLYRWLALLVVAAAIAASIIELRAIDPAKSGVGLVTFAGGLIADRFHVFGTVLVCAVLALSLLGSEAYLRRAPARAGAFCALLLVSAAAAVVLVGEHEMTTFVVTAALLATSLVLLTAMTKTSGLTAEAALRQVILGGVALATAAYGLALLYAATGTTDLERLAAGAGISGRPVDGPMAAVGIAMFVLGLLFLVGAPPMQAWLGRAQEAAPGASAAYGSAIGVVVGTTVLLRFAVEGFGPGSTRWTVLVTVLAATAMLTGGFLALRAATIRRLVADLAVAQAGVLLLAVAADGRGIDGVTVAGPTALLYTLMAGASALVAALLLIGVFDTAGLGGAVTVYRGVGRRAPATSAFLAIALLGLAGLPPFAGFIGRLLVAQAALDAGNGWAVAMEAVSVVLCALAVLRWLVVMYAEDTAEPPFAVRTTPFVSRATAWTAATLGLVLAAAAGPLISIAGGGATALH